MRLNSIQATQNRFAKVFVPFIALVLFPNLAAFAAEPQTNEAYRAVGTYITGASDVLPSTNGVQSPLAFDSSDAQLVKGFNWAKAQALAYVFDDGDAVGPWYEAVEPGREGFCMRDTSHQAMGAQALGLARFTHNMLRHFAEDISDSKDWCSYWEINRFNEPAPVDYKNDAEFWYDLPANFDVLDCCFRMYVWSGDRSYINDPVFLNFYNRTVNDYVERWGLGINEVMKRPRLLNVRGIFDATKKFPKNRGIPGYDEQDHTYILGCDVLVTERAAYLAYAHIQQVRFNADLAQEFLDKATAVENLLTNSWWDESNQCFYARLNKDYQLEGDGPKTLDWHEAGHVDAEATYSNLMYAAFSPKSRREYPETSFTWIGDLVNDTMGINPVFTSPLQSAVGGYWVEVMVQTLPALDSKTKWAEIRNLPIRANVVTVRHDGNGKTQFINQSGPALIWKASFAGAHETLLVNGKPAKATVENDSAGQPVSWVRVIVGAGGTSTVEVAK
ncbi:MAG TPA: hypothetical protein VMD27_10325 [Candidatus Aquilonibacter sp.]|nr:hypothetical protein [Candidatus Aquilonibacter sp.]